MKRVAIEITGNNGYLIIKELELLGAQNSSNLTGRANNGTYYYINKNGVIKSTWHPHKHLPLSAIYDSHVDYKIGKPRMVEENGYVSIFN
jgi:hypothetical protein